MNYENTISRIRRFSGNANTVIKVMLVMILAAGVLMLISAVMMTKDLNNPVIVGADGSVSKITSASAFCEAAGWLMNCIILTVIMLTAHRMTSVIAHDGQPFRAYICSNLKKISMLLVLLALIPPFVNIILKSVLISGGLLPGYFLNVQQIVYSVSDIFTAAILFIIAKVFEYGCELQRESDETL